MRNNTQTQVVATIGPASSGEAHIAELIDAGLDVARLNMSWGTHEEDAETIETVRRLAEQTGLRIPIVCDLSGPRVQDDKGHHFNESQTEILSEKDFADIAFGVSQHVEYFALSYVGSADDVQTLRSHLQELGSDAKIIAKIERVCAVERATEIIAASDAIMVARGDLGDVLPLEKLPFIEQDLVYATRAAGKPVIVATAMMDAMIENPEPSRSNVVDVAFAVLEGATAVMLSDETARGKHPTEALAMMDRVVFEAEKHREMGAPLQL